tara:strand:+ start:594 stop:1253 length:660 start_codon:yes stop_codon:yes gene_type:complete
MEITTMNISSWTNNKAFDKDGHLLVKNICDPASLVSDYPEAKGLYKFYGKGLDDYNFQPDQEQVDGAIARYWYPKYNEVHTELRKKIEQVIGRKLYNTYYYDRFYFPGQPLKKHKDRDACEISVSVHVATNLPDNDSQWPFKITTPEGTDASVVLKPGDGVIYKGCECEHWRDPMPYPRRRKRDLIFRKKQPEYYYHQIFFHYVLADGMRSHFAGDRCS